MAVCWLDVLAVSPGRTAGVPSRLEIKADGTAYVTGKLVENSHMCEGDGTCFLRLSVNGQEVRIAYGAEQHEACPNGFRNKVAMDAAWALKKGQRLEALGRHQYFEHPRIPKGQHVIAVCDSAGYIRPL